MRSCEENYNMVIENMKIVDDPENLKCTCPNTLCVWHGRCRECVAIHRYHEDHVPECFQLIFNSKGEKR
ncbi:hypothetical protein [Lutispora sp.]|uniref:hypothetical protein n=1 Tax=Lutispora sp. TaxID=2828727 RepID=UPI00356530DF